MAVHEIAAGTTVSYGGAWRAARPSRIATLPIGYADGYPRHVRDAAALLRGRRVPIVGAVCMDMLMVDVTDVPQVRVGDECVVLGSQKGTAGEASITAEELARTLGTIPWEVLTSVSRRVPRFYREP